MESTLKELGFILEEEQPHLSGERFLMMKDKQVLVGQDRNSNRVILKVATKQGGKEEIEREKKARDLLKKATFANDKILFPDEVFFGAKDNYLIWATEFIPQEKVFVAHPLEEQFFLILRAFEEQEAFHATTFEHIKSIESFFPVFHAREYFGEFRKFKESLKKLNDRELDKTMEEAEAFLTSHKSIIDTYCNYLTHTDFVPHNFRIKGKSIYMLDLSAVQFGNKCEGWARFLNYMIIHNPKLEKLLNDYVRQNRGADEYLNLRLMRIYKLGFLLDFYARSIEKTEGDLRTLTLERIGFWHEVLKRILKDEPVPQDLIERYKAKRDDLRSDEEKKRQKEFAIA